MFSYIKYRDGHRKAIPVATARKLRAAMKPGTQLSPTQEAFIKNIDHVYITSATHSNVDTPTAAVTWWNE